MLTALAPDEQISTAHRAKRTYVYVRQSSVNQMKHHRESTELQYRLVDRAIRFGWPRERIEVIDEDLGKSSASGTNRSGFQKLIAEIGLRNAGLVVSLDASRLARNNRDWHQLLELCSLFGVLIADGERLFNPCLYHDRLLLGLSGIMSEAELHQIHIRLHQGERQKAARGELRIPVRPAWPTTGRAPSSSTRMKRCRRGARHQGKNATCTQIGNDHFTWFGTTGSKSRLNFLELLRAGHTDYVINEEALAYMRERALAGALIARLASHAQRRFADLAAWAAHLQSLGIADLAVTPDPVRIATEGALFGSIKAHDFLCQAVIVSDDAGQFDVGRHALCWVHAERLVHKLDAFTEIGRKAQEKLRSLIWWFYRDLLAYKRQPSARRKAEMRARFERIFKRRTGFVTLERLLARLHANRAELLMALDRPEIPLHTNGSERDIRCYVIKRKISGGTRSHRGRDGRDAFLGLAKTCMKLGIPFWDYLGARLEIPNQPAVPSLPALIRSRCASA